MKMEIFIPVDGAEWFADRTLSIEVQPINQSMSSLIFPNCYESATPRAYLPVTLDIPCVNTYHSETASTDVEEPVKKN